jgi:hypothetical protein
MLRSVPRPHSHSGISVYETSRTAEGDIGDLEDVCARAHYVSMRRIVFYSWQSDLPNQTNRGFIETALEQAAATIAADDTVSIEPVVDRDTQNVAGSPDIASTIFTKIASADIFVADVSIVTRAEKMRPAPNPNVLIELGYALKALGHERIILIFNRAFGGLEELPFDLRTRRILVYEMQEIAAQRAPERKQLERQLEAALRAALAGLPETLVKPFPIPAVSAIENAASNRKVVLRRNLGELLSNIDKLEPKKPRDGGTADELIDAIDKSQEVVGEFSKIVETIAAMNDVDSAIEIYHWFGNLFERYNLPEGYSGRYSPADQDYFKFVGHEVFVTFVAFLMREQQWETLVRVLDEPIPMRIPNRGPGSVGWEYASQHLALLLDESRKKRRMSLHADLLERRHGQAGGLAAILPMQELMDADYFLFLLSRTLKDDTGYDGHYWRAWSCLYLKHTPSFIQKSERKRFAEEVTKTLGLSGVEEFRKLLAERGPELAKLFQNTGGWWDYPIERNYIDRIGTR